MKVHGLWLGAIGVLIAGVLVAVPAVGWAEAGSPSNDSAAAQVYPQAQEDPIVGGREEGPGDGLEEGPDEEPAVVEEVTQAGTTGGDLPFTGLLVIPLLVVAVVLMGAGAVLRRRATGSNRG